METSIFIAKMFAIVYIFVGIGFFLNPKYYKNALDTMIKDPIMYYYGGIMATIAGFLIVNFHNTWEKSWVVIITIFGWMALIKGFMLFVCPKHFAFWGKLIKKTNLRVLSIFVLGMGIMFGYFGFMI